MLKRTAYAVAALADTSPGVAERAIRYGIDACRGFVVRERLRAAFRRLGLSESGAGFVPELRLERALPSRSR